MAKDIVSVRPYTRCSRNTEFLKVLRSIAHQESHNTSTCMSTRGELADMSTRGELADGVQEGSVASQCSDAFVRVAD